jgi:hypothetical protein
MRDLLSLALDAGVAQLDHSMLAGSGDWLAGTSDSVEGKRGILFWHAGIDQIYK